mgnify:CR=1 FL=1
MQAFDTHAAVKNLESAGLATPAAEMIVKNIVDSRNFDLSNFITKDKFISFQTEIKTTVAQKISAITSDTTVMQNDSEWIKQNMVTKSELKAEIAEVRNELKAEIAEVRTEIAGVKSELKAEIAEIRTELKAEIAEIKSNIEEKISTLRLSLENKISESKIDMIKWMVGLMIAQITILVGAAKLFL